MANHKSAIKRHRQSVEANARNRAVKSRLKKAVKGVDAAVEQNDPQEAAVALRKATVLLDKAAQKRVIHRNKAARKISRLSKAVNSINS